jgi:hypothetical protein
LVFGAGVVLRGHCIGVAMRMLKGSVDDDGWCWR